MLVFGSSLSNHNPYLGFHGDLDAAAKACFKTAWYFGGLACISLAYFVITAVRAKRGYGVGGGSRASYTAM